jgi:hypothetical protein
VSTVIKLTTAEIDTRIEAVRSTLDRTTARLVELDADVTRRLLETAQDLGPTTAAAWADAARRHDALWQGQFALEEFLTQVAEERGTKRTAPQWVLARLNAMLNGPSVVLPPPGDGRPPRLTEQPGPTVACSITEAFERMSADFDVVTELVRVVAWVWGELTERLGQVAALVGELEREVGESGMRRPNDLDFLARAQHVVETTAREDPVALPPDEVARLEARAQCLRALVDEGSRESRVQGETFLEADRAIGAGLESVAASRVRVELWSERIVFPAATMEELDTLGRELERLRLESVQARNLGIGSSADDLRRRGEHICDKVRRLMTNESARVARRDELRGLLGAYRAKAAAVGLAENPEIDVLSNAALEALYEAPCNIEEAELRVTGLQRAIVRLQGAPS